MSNEEKQAGEPDGTLETHFNTSDPWPVKKIPLPAEKQVKTGSGRRSIAKSDMKTGRYVRSEIPPKKITDIALDATITAAAPHQRSRNNQDQGIVIESSDMRQKVRERKIGNTILFVVDASGSMGADKRMIAVKGAVLSLLIDAYQKRDKVGMIAFKDNSASVLLPPTSSVELAKKSLEELPTGGKTPLAAGLLTAYKVFKTEQTKDKKARMLMVLVSDGRMNVSLSQGVDPFAEAEYIAREIKQAGIRSLVLDTETGLIRLGKMQQISETLSGHYYLLEDIRGERIADIVKSSIE